MTTPIVTVRGEAQLEVPPDLATLAFTVHSTGNSVEGPRTELAEASTQVRDLLAEHATAIERSSTSGLHIALIFALTPLPNSQIDGPWWSLRRDNAAFRNVRLDAITDARRRADDYAAAFGASVADLVEVSDLETGLPSGREMRTFAMAKGMADDVDFELGPATQAVSGQVTVRFALSTPDLQPVSER